MIQSIGEFIIDYKCLGLLELIDSRLSSDHKVIVTEDDDCREIRVTVVSRNQSPNNIVSLPNFQKQSNLMTAILEDPQTHEFITGCLKQKTLDVESVEKNIGRILVGLVHGTLEISAKYEVLKKAVATISSELLQDQTFLDCYINTVLPNNPELLKVYRETQKVQLDDVVEHFSEIINTIYSKKNDDKPQQEEAENNNDVNEGTPPVETK